MLIGEGGVGKESFIQRVKGMEFNNNYVATNGGQVHNLLVNTNQGSVNFELWVTAGQDQPGDLGNEYYENLHAAFLMFDLHSLSTYKEMKKWHRDVTRHHPDVPFVLIANKADGEPKVQERRINLHTRVPNMSYVRMSVKYDETAVLFTPLLCVAEKLMGLEAGTLRLEDVHSYDHNDNEQEETASQGAAFDGVDDNNDNDEVVSDVSISVSHHFLRFTVLLQSTHTSHIGIGISFVQQGDKEEVEEDAKSLSATASPATATNTTTNNAHDAFSTPSPLQDNRFSSYIPTCPMKPRNK